MGVPPMAGGVGHCSGMQRRSPVVDRLATCTFSYREALPDAPPSEKWLPAWDRPDLPAAVKIEMTPLDSSAALLPVMNVTVSIHVTRQVRPPYEDHL